MGVGLDVVAEVWANVEAGVEPGVGLGVDMAKPSDAPGLGIGVGAGVKEEVGSAPSDGLDLPLKLLGVGLIRRWRWRSSFFVLCQSLEGPP